ncbi:MAG TPA: lysine transporter LysE, partial [Deltaproteobacteria bacterium]|nr:lysine transporter LysE [Deltaproteobacteria bacterium]
LITPGPGVLSTAGVGSGFGRQAGLIFLTGLFLGTNLVALAVVAGYAALVFSIPYVREVLMAGSFGYLLWLALKIALAGRRLSWIESEKPPGFHGGILLQIINPKVYVVSTAIFSGFPFDGISLLAETLWKFLIFNVIWIPIHFLWLYAGVSLKRMNLSERSQFLINSGMSVAMVGVVVLAALAQ